MKTAANPIPASTMYGVEAMERCDFDGRAHLVMLVLASGEQQPDAIADLSPVAARDLARQLIAAAKKAEGKELLAPTTSTSVFAGQA